VLRPSAPGSAGVNGGEGDGLRPPARIGAVVDEPVDELVVEPPRVDELAAELGDRLRPVVPPWRAPVVDGRLGGARDLLDDRTSTSDRSRSTATTRPRGPTRSASQAETEPLPQPTSSARAS
jgi:hypothetical protein